MQEITSEKLAWELYVTCHQQTATINQLTDWLRQIANIVGVDGEEINFNEISNAVFKLTASEKTAVLEK